MTLTHDDADQPKTVARLRLKLVNGDRSIDPPPQKKPSTSDENEPTPPPYSATAVRMMRNMGHKGIWAYASKTPLSCLFGLKTDFY